MVYHVTNLGEFAGHDLITDFHGHVRTSIRDVLAARDNYDGPRLTRRQAAAIALNNREATRKAELKIQEWRCR